SRQRPLMIHRAPFGSLERLIGILIEEYAGDFPLWLAPVQMRLLPVTEDQLGYAQSVAELLLAQGVRVEVDTSGDRLGKMVRNAEKAKVPIMTVVGAKELEANTLSIRTRAQGELGSLPVAEVVERVAGAIATREDF
ncbi:MAG: His/Gly/Thr/Pro-type tRNA ligase C-terminal domain-containing protein, partial [Nodosilinea sp.]